MVPYRFSPDSNVSTRGRESCAMTERKSEGEKKAARDEGGILHHFTRDKTRLTSNPTLPTIIKADAIPNPNYPYSALATPSVCTY